ncbi:MAG: sigma-54 dependent transcriptional regulator, partial [Gammaproteobacteria bacterium]|nr:sigma-54 dependent transcriptional regulator [Gammaproteobacteria bacterium]
TRYDMLICDDRLPDGTGGELFETLNETVPAVPPTVFITGFGSINRAVALLKLGAMDYVTKPFDIEDLLGKINVHCRPGRPPVDGPSRAPILGVSSAMRDVEATLHRIAAYSSHTVITGESGVGKEEVAKRLHALAFPGQERPFIAIDCGAVSQALLESELFGHERGAFTGAVRARRGVFEQADGGTLFFDEIANMPLAMQVKLLRVLQDSLVTRVGGEQRRQVDFRLICATNRDLKSLVQSGVFREDLFYRINVVHIQVPPLRERHEDILWLADRFLNAHNEAHPETSRAWGPGAMESLVCHSWPGNVRELKHCIERTWVMSRGPTLECEDLLSGFKSITDGGHASDPDLRTYLRACERARIVEVLERNDWAIGRSAGELGISRKNLWERMRRLEIDAIA